MPRLADIIHRLRRLPAAVPLLGVLALATVFEHKLTGSQSFLENTYVRRAELGQERTLLRYRAQLARAHESDATKVFFLGSSQLHYAIDTRMLNLWARDSGVEFYSFWQPNLADPVSASFMLDEMLETEPDVVIYMPALRFLHRRKGASASLDRWRQPIRDYLQIGELPWLQEQLGWQPLLSNFEWLAGALLIKALPIAHLKLTARETGVHLFGRPAPQPAWLPIDRRERHPYEQVHPFESELAMDEAAKHRQSLDFFRELDPVQLGALRRIATDVKDAGAGFALIDAPHHPLFVRTSEGAIETYKRYHGTLHELAEEFRIPFWGPGDLPVVDAEDFIDVDHLGTHQRRRFSKFVFSLLRRERGQIAPSGALAALGDAAEGDIGWRLSGPSGRQISLVSQLQAAHIQLPVSIRTMDGSLVAETSRDSVRTPFAGAAPVGRHKNHWKAFAPTGRPSAGGYLVRYGRGQGTRKLDFALGPAGQRCLGVRGIRVLDRGHYWRTLATEPPPATVREIRIHAQGDIELTFSRSVDADEIVELDCFAPARTLVWDPEDGIITGILRGVGASWISNGESRQQITLPDTVIAAVPGRGEDGEARAAGIWISGTYQDLHDIEGIGTTRVTVHFSHPPPAGAPLTLPVAMPAELADDEQVTVYPTYLE